MTHVRRCRHERGPPGRRRSGAPACSRTISVAGVTTPGHASRRSTSRSPALDRDTQMGGFVLAGALAFRLFVYLLPLYLLVLVSASAALSVDPDSPRVLATTAGVSASLATMVSEAAADLEAQPVDPRAGHASLRSRSRRTPPTRWCTPRTSGPGTWPTRRSMRSTATPLGRLPGRVAVRRRRPLRAASSPPRAADPRRDGQRLAVLLRSVARQLTRVLPRARVQVGGGSLPGALLVGIGTQGLYLFTVLYLNRRIESATEVYGALGIAASCLAWLYLVGRLVVAAPVLNATLWERFGHRGGAMTDDRELFEPARLGPVELRNRIIKAATFEGVTPDGVVTDELVRVPPTRRRGRRCDEHRRLPVGRPGGTHRLGLPPGRARRGRRPAPPDRRDPRRRSEGVRAGRSRRPGRQRPVEPGDVDHARTHVQPAGHALQPGGRRVRHRAHHQ